MKQREEIYKEFDEKYGYEYPRCALTVKNVEVRDEDDNLVGYNHAGAVTPDEMKSFISSLRKDDIESIVEWGIKNRELIEEHKYCKNEGERWENGYDCAMIDLISHLQGLKETI